MENMPWWLILIGIGIGAIIVFIVIATKGRVKISKEGLEIDSGTGIKIKKAKPCPNNDRTNLCPNLKPIVSDYLKDFVYTWKEQRQVHIDSFNIEKTIIPEQMRLAERFIDSAISEMNSLFLKLLSTQYAKEELFKTREQKSYRNILEYIVKDEMKRQARIRCKDNHFAERTPEQFRDYIKQTTELFIKSISNVLDLVYPDDFKISRAELFEFHEQHQYIFENMVDEYLWKARQIAAAAYEKIESIKNNFDQRFQNKFEIKDIIV